MSDYIYSEKKSNSGGLCCGSRSKEKLHFDKDKLYDGVSGPGLKYTPITKSAAQN